METNILLQGIFGNRLRGLGYRVILSQKPLNEVSGSRGFSKLGAPKSLGYGLGHIEVHRGGFMETRNFDRSSPASSASDSCV